MELNTLNPGKAAKGKSRKRIGRGPGSGWGTTAGRGEKGAGARKSAKAGRVAFEGGQISASLVSALLISMPRSSSTRASSRTSNCRSRSSLLVLSTRLST